MTHAEIRDLLVRACLDVGLPPPRPDQGLIAWEEELLDAPLAPRGGPAWQEARGLLVDGFQAAVEGSESIARALLAGVAQSIAAEGRRTCGCARPACPQDDGFGRMRCARCYGRVERVESAREVARKLHAHLLKTGQLAPR